MFRYPRSSRLPLRERPHLYLRTPAARWWCSDILDHRVSPYASGPTYIREHTRSSLVMFRYPRSSRLPFTRAAPPISANTRSSLVMFRYPRSSRLPLRERPHLYLRTPAARWWCSDILDHRVSPYASGPTYICEHPQLAGDVQIS